MAIELRRFVTEGGKIPWYESEAASVYTSNSRGLGDE